MQFRSNKRRGLFDLSEQEQGDTTMLVGFTNKIPKVVMSGSKFDDDERRLNGKAFASCIDLLWRHPDACQATESFIRDKTQQLKAKKASAVCFVDLTVWKGLDDTFHCKMIIAASGGKLTQAILEQAVAKDPMTMFQLDEFAAGIMPSLFINDLGRHHAVLHKAYLSIIEKNGNRLQGIDVDSVVERSGKMNWKVVGVYCAEGWDADKGVFGYVKHRPSGFRVRIPEVQPISDSFKVRSNWSDLRAEFVLGKLAHPSCAS